MHNESQFNYSTFKIGMPKAINFITYKSLISMKHHKNNVD